MYMATVLGIPRDSGLKIRFCRQYNHQEGPGVGIISMPDQKSKVPFRFSLLVECDLKKVSGSQRKNN